MKMFVIGTVFGLVVAAVGFSGVAKIFDNGVQKIQSTAKEAAQ